MKRSWAILALVFVLIISLVPAIAFATEAVAGDSFDPNTLVVAGVSLPMVISVLISILKGWVKIDSKYIPLINVGMGTVAVLAVGIVNDGLSPLNAIIMTLGVVLGSAMFHDTFGHAAKILSEVLGKKPQTEQLEE